MKLRYINVDIDIDISDSHKLLFLFFVSAFVVNKRIYCRGGPAPDRLSAALVSRKFAVARACVRWPRQQADVSAAG